MHYLMVCGWFDLACARDGSWRMLCRSTAVVSEILIAYVNAQFVVVQ